MIGSDCNKRVLIRRLSPNDPADLRHFWTAMKYISPAPRRSKCSTPSSHVLTATRRRARAGTSMGAHGPLMHSLTIRRSEAQGQPIALLWSGARTLSRSGRSRFGLLHGEADPTRVTSQVGEPRVL